MAFEQPGFMTSIVAGGDLSTKQHYFVKLNSSGQVVICAAVTDIPCGVVQNNPVSGAAANVMVSGISKIVGGADLAKGAQIGTDGAGKAVAYVNGTDTTKYVVGQVIDDNTADGGKVSAMINCFAPGRAA